MALQVDVRMVDLHQQQHGERQSQSRRNATQHCWPTRADAMDESTQNYNSERCDRLTLVSHMTFGGSCG